jgi:fructose-1,6-bisphosphatase
MGKKAKRVLIARMLAIGCNSIESMKVMAFNEAIRRYADEALSPKERKYLNQRCRIIGDMVKDIRKLQWRLEQ